MPGRRARGDSLYAEDARRLRDVVRAGRERLGLTQDELAYRAHVSSSTVRKLEGGQIQEPGFFPVLALLTVLEIDLRELELPTVTRTRRRSRLLEDL